MNSRFGNLPAVTYAEMLYSFHEFGTPEAGYVDVKNIYEKIISLKLRVKLAPE